MAWALEKRLLLWSVLQMGKPLSSLTHEDLLLYQHFLTDPQPSARWTASGGRKHPRGDPRWRPFYGPLSATSQRQAMVILNVMFACWCRRVTSRAIRYHFRANAHGTPSRASRAICRPSYGSR
jgi:hypothetical protein